MKAAGIVTPMRLMHLGRNRLIALSKIIANLPDFSVIEV